jgi:putative colanic acid biosynthesis UDP-glucose lipid carrier transferase
MRMLGRKASSSSLNASDPSFLFVFKTLFYPIVACLPLILATAACGESFTGPYFLSAVLTLLITNIILDVALVHLAGERRYGLSELLDICVRWALVVFIVSVLLYLGGELRSLNQNVVFVWVFVTPFVLWATQNLAKLAMRYFMPMRTTSRKAVIVAASDVGLRLEEVLARNPLLRTEFVGFFEDRSGDRVSDDVKSRILGKTQDLPGYISRHGIHTVYITIPMSRQQRITNLLNDLRDSTASIYFVPDLLTFNLIQARIDSLGGIPLIAVCESPFIGLSGLVKRLMDLAVASALLVLTFPLIVAVAIGVRLSSPGSILFRQVRYGLDGQPIRVYKFRSMAVAEDGASTYKQVVRNDPRVTRFGAFIRKVSLDELPQLFNVLEGTMSIVGPRPHVVAVNEQYRKLIPGYMVRHKVKPGITGWAQINGYRGGDDLGSMAKRIECDLEYLRGWSVGLDVLILFKTVVLIWNDGKAY